MKVQRREDGKVFIELPLDKGNDLAEAVALNNNDNMPSALLELASLLRNAHYEAHDEFRQPPHAWEPGLPHPSTTREA